MAKSFCPLSEVAVNHIRSLSESYRLLIAAAIDYNGIALADRKQIEKALARADQVGEIIEGYICSWQRGAPCLVYSCGWELCRRSLDVLDVVNGMPVAASGINSEVPENRVYVAPTVAEIFAEGEEATD